MLKCFCLKVYGECDEDGFYFGECNGRKGFVPSNMVCEASADEVAEFLRRRGGPGGQHSRGRMGAPSASALPPGQMTNLHRLGGQYPGRSEQTSGHVSLNWHFFNNLVKMEYSGRGHSSITIGAEEYK